MHSWFFKHFLFYLGNGFCSRAALKSIYASLLWLPSVNCYERWQNFRHFSLKKNTPNFSFLEFSIKSNRLYFEIQFRISRDSANSCWFSVIESICSDEFDEVTLFLCALQRSRWIILICTFWTLLNVHKRMRSNYFEFIYCAHFFLLLNELNSIHYRFQWMNHEKQTIQLKLLTFTIRIQFN